MTGRLATLMVTVAVAACAATAPAPSMTAKPGLEPAFATVDELVAATVTALEAKDLDRLRQLAVTREEFRDLVWPGLDASRPERNLTWEFVWSQHEMRHERGLRRALDQFGGQHLEVRAIRFEGVTEHGTYRLHRSSTLEVVGPDGSVRTVRVFASVIEAEGRYKIYSFITD
jgi:hypothetical protein